MVREATSSLLVYSSVVLTGVAFWWGVGILISQFGL